MSRERVVVVLEYRIYVYNFSDLNLLHTIETISNPHGLCALCTDSRACVIACCGLQKGHVSPLAQWIVQSLLARRKPPRSTYSKPSGVVVAEVEPRSPGRSAPPIR
eukprot:scaffold19367_cov33-Tisochrysis_lutea.AAC.4